MAGLENCGQSEDPPARDFELIAFPVAEWVVRPSRKGNLHYCTSVAAACAGVPASRWAWFWAHGLGNKMGHPLGAYMLAEGTRQ